jgi:hypothetical protein
MQWGSGRRVRAQPYFYNPQVLQVVTLPVTWIILRMIDAALQPRQLRQAIAILHAYITERFTHIAQVACIQNSIY